MSQLNDSPAATPVPKVNAVLNKPKDWDTWLYKVKDEAVAARRLAVHEPGQSWTSTTSTTAGAYIYGCQP